MFTIKIDKCRCGSPAELHPAEGMQYHVAGCMVCGESISAPSYVPVEMIIDAWKKQQDLSTETNENGHFVYSLDNEAKGW